MARGSWCVVGEEVECGVVASGFRFEDVGPSRMRRTVTVRRVYFPPGRTYSPGTVAREVTGMPRLFLITVSGSANGLTNFLGNITASRRGFESRFFASVSLYSRGNGGIVLLNLSILPRCHKRNLTERLICHCDQHRGTGKQGGLFLAYLRRGMRVCGGFKLRSLKVTSSA